MNNNKLPNGKYRGEMELDLFLSLPRRAQQLFFEYMGNNYMNGGNPFQAFHIIEFGCNGCDSPIEKIFMLAYLLVTFNMDGLSYYRYSLIPQYEIECGKKKYRVDFLFDTVENTMPDIEFKKDYKLVIECDGYDFHERTKQQVINDNERTLDLKTHGYDVIRFSGTQIYVDPMDCAMKTVKMIALNLGDINNG